MIGAEIPGYELSMPEVLVEFRVNTGCLIEANRIRAHRAI
jgi:hypothetical protein